MVIISFPLLDLWQVADEIARAQHRGLKVWAETCTHYLHITDADLDRPGLEGAKFIHSPAPRAAVEHEALWRHIRSGTLGNVTSDHAPSCAESHTTVPFRPAPHHAATVPPYRPLCSTHTSGLRICVRFRRVCGCVRGGSPRPSLEL